MAATTNQTVQVYDVATAGLTKLIETDCNCKIVHSITGIKFANNDQHTLYISTEDGKILLYDLRTQQLANTYEESTENTKNVSKIYSCFDINQNDRVLCSGTERVNQDAFLVFFDVRQTVQMGSYWESHPDDISQVKFHPKNPDRLAAGSVDGLINVFDISKSCEDDALEYCLNTESSVQKLNWHQNTNNNDILSCITYTNDFHLYDVAESELIVQHNRQFITEHLKVLGTMNL